MNNNDWFNISHQFTVTSAEELFEYLRAASLELLDEADADYEMTADAECKLAVSMLENIGVKTDAKSR